MDITACLKGKDLSLFVMDGSSGICWKVFVGINIPSVFRHLGIQACIIPISQSH